MPIVVSWNILADVFAVCRYYKSYTKCEYLESSSRYEKVIRRLKSFKADIIGLQEITENSVEEIKDAFGDKYHIIVGYHGPNHWKTSKKVRNGNLIMIRKKYAGVSKSVLSKFSANGNRGLITYLNNGIIVCCFHFDDADTQLRVQQINSMIKKVGKHEPVILMGDSNDPSNFISKVMEINGFKFNSTGPTNFEDYPMTIDYIFVRGFSKIKTKVSQSSKTTILKNYGSDHLPVIARVD